MSAFRYDATRDAYVLRVVGNRLGPVLQTRPAIDGAAEQQEWDERMDTLRR